MGKNGKKGKAPMGKDELIATSRLAELEKKISENTEIAKEIDTWLTSKKEKEEELQALEEKISLYGEAAEIIAKKEEILGDAQTTHDELTEQIEEDSEKHAKLLKEIEELKEIYGAYEQAEDIVSSAKKECEKVKNDTEKEVEEIKVKSNKLISDAEKNAEKIIADAEKKSNEIVDAATEAAKAKEKEAETKYNEVLAQRDEILTSAQESAERILTEANEKRTELFKCKEAEGEAVKDRIIDLANNEREQIISLAHKDAELIKERIEKSANDYSEKIRTAAERDSEEIKNSAQSQADKLIQYATEIRTQAESDAEKTRENAYKEMQGKREQLDRQISDINLKEEDLRRREKELDQLSEVLERRDDNLEEIIAERVEKEIIDKKDEFENTKNTANKLARRVKELSDIINTSKEIKSGAIENAEKLKEYQEIVEQLAAKGITLENAEKFVLASEELKKTEKKRDKLLEENKALKDERAINNSSDEQIAKLREQNQTYEDVIRELREELDRNKTVSREDMIKPIKTAPAFMSQNGLKDDREIGDETAWLKNIKEKSRKCGFIFTDRQINAYHTAQKIKDMSPLVVLAGVSGTGKSALPKNYAVHGGMNFLSIPVKPDWDSPASLFGYFNSIERRFEATNLVKALYQMNKGTYNDQLMMVLLDEMNLAHPEQYFADLLSELENSRGSLAGAQYDIVLGGGEEIEPLMIGSNILWTGTMNEDETTKGLSDKVIDRSTLITFPRPKTLYDKKENEEIKQEFILSRNKWDDWCSKGEIIIANEEVSKQLDKYRGVVEQINDHMSDMGRNLGHRVWQAISKYICNYPEVIHGINGKKEELHAAMQKAFADAIAFKIMPKLRGVEVRGHNEDRLDEIGTIISHNAKELENDYKNARELTTELFQWCSADFMNKDE